MCVGTGGAVSFPSRLTIGAISSACGLLAWFVCVWGGGGVCLCLRVLKYVCLRVFICAGACVLCVEVCGVYVCV